MKSAFCAVALATLTGLPAVATAQFAPGEGPYLARFRALHMLVDNSNSPTIAGGPVEANSKWFPEVDGTYFFTPNIAAELILTYPQRHDVKLGGTKIGTLKHLPPTLTVQYHFMPNGQFRPYAGIGLNYTRFMSVSLPTGLDVERSSFGLALQVGADIKLTGRWFLNVDAKYVQIETDVKAGGNKLTTLGIDPWLLSLGVGYRF